MSDLSLPGGSGLLHSPLRLIALLLFCALGYAVAAYGMKLYSTLATGSAMGLIAGGFALAIVTEVAILRRMELSSGYVFILAIETLLVLGLALWLGETLDARKIFGVGFVVTGLALVF